MRSEEKKWIRAGELAHLAGLSYSKVDHWAERDLLQFKRENGRTRVFAVEENLHRCRFIQQKQGEREGNSLEAIRKMIDAGDHRAVGGARRLSS